jgi:hypothetical protein
MFQHPIPRKGEIITEGFIQELAQKADRPITGVGVTDTPFGVTISVPFSPNDSLKLGKLDTALAKGGSATVSIWTKTDSSEADSTQNVTAYDWLMKVGATSLAAGKKVVVGKVGALWIVLECECA